jgi:threonine dehydratase
MELVTLDDIEEAARLLAGIASFTPMKHSRVLTERAGGEVFLKCENLQRTGAFKIRGAYNRIHKLPDSERSKGVVAASAGNHAQGVALAASLLGVRATVFMPVGAALPKVEATGKYGAKVVLEGEVYDDSYMAAKSFSETTGAVMVHPFDHSDVIAGQGTVGLEIARQLPEAKSIVVPLGGGGLISGIAVAAQALVPGVRIFGVEPENVPDMKRAIEAGHIVELEKISTIADGLATKRAGELTFEYVRKLVDDIALVSEDEIAEALLLIAERAKLVVEPAGAAGVAAVMTKKLDLEFPAVVLLSGGNIDPLLLLRVIRFGMGSAGRYFTFSTRLKDLPGELHRLLGIIAEAGANVIGVEHYREGARLDHLGEVTVTVQAETRGPEHVAQLQAALTEGGYSVTPI